MRLIDTTVAIDHLRGVQAATDLLVDLASAGEDLAASEVVRFEILVGSRPREVRAVEQFFDMIVWVPVGEQIARIAARLAKQFRASHSGIGEADYLIAATALTLDVDLLTTNVKHFPMFSGLTAPY